MTARLAGLRDDRTGSRGSPWSPKRPTQPPKSRRGIIKTPGRLWISVLQEMHWARRHGFPFRVTCIPVAPTGLLRTFVKIAHPLEPIFEFGGLVCAPLSVDDILLELIPLG